MTITEFLTARLDEDEAVALRADDFEVEEFTWASVDYWCASNDAHGMRWSPKRVVADVAAKRAIVEWCSERDRVYIGGIGWGDPADTRSYIPGDYLRPGDAPILRMLALPYADHPDYQEEWKP
jgi:hypothetical protein